MTTVVISQPMYFPWIGFLGQMSVADVYIWLDDAQFSKGSFTNRIQVKTGADCTWMTIPLRGKGTGQRIKDLAAVDTKWRSSHRDLLRQQLKGRTFASATLDIFDRCILEHSEPLVDLLIASVEEPARYLGVLPKTVLRSSEMDVGGASSERVAALVKAAHGARYVTGHGAAQYLDHELFERQGIKIDYMDYAVNPWDQGGGSFTPYVTILDPIASLGAAAAGHLPRGTIGWRDFVQTRQSA